MNPWLIARRSRLPTLKHTQSSWNAPIEGASAIAPRAIFELSGANLRDQEEDG